MFHDKFNKEGKMTTTMIGSTTAVDAIGRVSHEAHRAYCIILGDPPLPGWDEVEEIYRESTRVGVRKALEGNTPEKSHESWMAEQQSQGWVFGAPLDRQRKIHPNLVPYDMLPSEQKVKDRLFLAILSALK